MTLMTIPYKLFNKFIPNVLYSIESNDNKNRDLTEYRKKKILTTAGTKNK